MKREDPRIADLTRAVMEEIRECSPGARLADVPTLFAFGPIYRAIQEAEARAVVGAPPETAQFGDPQPAWTVGAHYVLGGWRRDISDLAGLGRAVNQGIDASPIGQVSVVRHGRPFTDEPGWAIVGSPVLTPIELDWVVDLLLQQRLNDTSARDEIVRKLRASGARLGPAGPPET